jgi:hypothetical protein
MINVEYFNNLNNLLQLFCFSSIVTAVPEAKMSGDPPARFIQTLTRATLLRASPAQATACRSRASFSSFKRLSLFRE